MDGEEEDVMKKIQIETKMVTSKVFGWLKKKADGENDSSELR